MIVEKHSVCKKKKKDVKVYILEKSEYWILLFCSYTEILVLEKMKALEMNSCVVCKSIYSFGNNKTNHKLYWP